MDAERVPDLVAERQILMPEHDMADIFFGTLTTEAERAIEPRRQRRRRSERRRRSLDFWRARDSRRGGRRRRDELLEHAGGFLATRHAAGEALLLAARDRLGIRLAEITALPAIELAHRGHHSPLLRAAVRELHALVERQRRVVPGKFLGRRVGGLRNGQRRRLHDRRSRVRQQCLIGADQAGQQAVEPGTLRRRERRIVGNDRRETAHGLILRTSSAPYSQAAASISSVSSSTL